MSTRPLQLDFRTFADASGNGTIEQGPQIPRTRWNLNTAGVQALNTVAIPQCNVYMNGTLVDGTFTGTLDSTDMVSGIPLSMGQKIKAQWTGADPGAELKLSITGTEESNYS